MEKVDNKDWEEYFLKALKIIHPIKPIEDITEEKTEFTPISMDDIINYYFIDKETNKHIQRVVFNISFSTIFSTDQIFNVATDVISSYCLHQLENLRYISLLTISKVKEIMVSNFNQDQWKYEVFTNMKLLDIFFELNFVKWTNVIIDIFYKYRNSMNLITNDEVCLYIINRIQEEYEVFE